jgi:glycogen synthase
MKPTPTGPGAACLFVLPSYREGFPRAAMEATACGVPVVATDIRGCRQVVDDGTTGLLVPVRDADALAAAIETLAADPARRLEMAAGCRQRAEAEFDDRAAIRITLSVYGRLLHERGVVPRRGAAVRPPAGGPSALVGPPEDAAAPARSPRSPAG